MAFQSVSKEDKDVCPEYGRQDYQSDDKLFSEYDQKNKDYRNKHGIAGFGMSRPLPCEPDLVYRGAKVKKDCAQCVHCSRCRTPQPQLLHGIFPVIRSMCYLSSICAPYREYRKLWKDTGNVFPRLFDDRDRKGYLFYHLISTLLQADTGTARTLFQIAPKCSPGSA